MTGLGLFVCGISLGFISGAVAEQRKVKYIPVIWAILYTAGLTLVIIGVLK